MRRPLHTCWVPPHKCRDSRPRLSEDTGQIPTDSPEACSYIIYDISLKFT